MMHRPDASSQRIRVRNRRRDIGLCQQHSLRQSAPLRQMARHRGRERAAGAVGRVRWQLRGFENFLLRPCPAGKAQQIDRFLQVTASDDDAGRTHFVKASDRHAHLLEIGDRQSGQSRRLVHDWA